MRGRSADPIQVTSGSRHVTDRDSDGVQSVSALSAETAVLAHQVEEGAISPSDVRVQARSESIFRRRVRKFRRIKRGYGSFLVIVAAYLLSFLLPLLANNVALVVRYQNEFLLPDSAVLPCRDVRTASHRRAGLSSTARNIRGVELRELGAHAAVPLRPERIAARPAWFPTASTVSGASIRHRRPRPRRAGTPRVWLQHLTDVCTAGHAHR